MPTTVQPGSPVNPSLPAFAPAASGQVQVIQPAQFRQAIAQGDTVVEFFSYGCGYCREAKGKVQQVANQLAGKAKIVAISVDDPAGKQIGIQHGLALYPTFAVFRDGAYKGTFMRDGANPVTAQHVRANIDRILGY